MTDKLSPEIEEAQTARTIRLIREDERERCAKVAQEKAERWQGTIGLWAGAADLDRRRYSARRGRERMSDPTYDQSKIEANPDWKLAFLLSELDNDFAPIGWSRYIALASALRLKFELIPKGQR